MISNLGVRSSSQSKNILLNLIQYGYLWCFFTTLSYFSGDMDVLGRSYLEIQIQQDKNYHNSNLTFFCFGKCLKKASQLYMFPNVWRCLRESETLTSISVDIWHKKNEQSLLCSEQTAISSWRKARELIDCKGCQSLRYDPHFKAKIHWTCWEKRD